MIERCDSCIQVAKYRVEMASGPLFFCGHHYTKAAAALMELAEAIEAIDA